MNEKNYQLIAFTEDMARLAYKYTKSIPLVAA